ncbi:hypothetical protein KKG72_11155 [bacterium]|nr:hypothetical protein [bacterium]MBU1993484.1 hypothetical protein [bacterium]
MTNLIISSLFIFLLSACSFQTPPNEWQYKSTAAFDLYVNNFLSSNDTLAKNDLHRAISHAKVSADLSPLARIYLGKCALNISVGIKDTCAEFADIQDMLNNEALNAYYSFITSNLQKEQIQHLPKIYKDFAWHVENKNFISASDTILKMDVPTSKLLSFALIKETLDKKQRTIIIEIASYHGFKKAVLFWLKEEMQKEVNTNEKKNILKKISILESKI